MFIVLLRLICIGKDYYTYIGIYIGIFKGIFKGGEIFSLYHDVHEDPAKKYITNPISKLQFYVTFESNVQSYSILVL